MALIFLLKRNKISMAKQLSHYIRFIERFTISTSLNTLFGILIFPFFYSVLPGLGIFTCMLLSYCSAVTFSFFTHSKITFRVSLSGRNFIFFSITQAAMFVLVYFCVKWFQFHLSVDPRLSQPFLAVLAQLIAITFYKKIFDEK